MDNYGYKLQSAIKKSTDSQVDAVWAILKYKEIGIYRKVASMCEVLNIGPLYIPNNFCFHVLAQNSFSLSSMPKGHLLSL